jgi:hypothetical protein
VAGTAFLPLERRLTQLLHPLYVRIRKWHSEHETRGLLLKSQTWLRVRGTITSVQYDSSLPREGLWYAYNPREGYYSGFSWRWFDSTIPMHVLAGDLVLLRYNPSNPDASVIVGCESQHSELAIPVELRG